MSLVLAAGVLVLWQSLRVEDNVRRPGAARNASTRVPTTGNTTQAHDAGGHKTGSSGAAAGFRPSVGKAKPTKGVSSQVASSKFQAEEAGTERSSHDDLQHEIADIDDEVQEIRLNATMTDYAPPEDYARLRELEIARWATLRHLMGEERFRDYFYMNSNAGSRLAGLLAPLNIPERDQAQLLARITHGGEIDEIDEDAVIDTVIDEFGERLGLDREGLSALIRGA